MIITFGNKTARDIYHGAESRYSRKLQQHLVKKAQRLLDQIHTAPALEFLLVPPGNRLEKLSGNLNGFWSLRINEQWRIIFRWIGKDAYDVQILDYH